LVAHLVARILYRVRTRGLEHLPKTGGVLLISNHITYVDVVVLQLVCPRPIRFVGHKGLRRNRFFNWCFEVCGCISLASAPNDISPAPDN
jgi:acyl-[acyl-carrier-protein]-phospholipid O-acyltransferase/long-chain-fatty-acid--[acyl-carrier-protein] ligase